MKKIKRIEKSKSIKEEREIDMNSNNKENIHVEKDHIRIENFNAKSFNKKESMLDVFNSIVDDRSKIIVTKKIEIPKKKFNNLHLKNITKLKGVFTNVNRKYSHNDDISKHLLSNEENDVTNIVPEVTIKKNKSIITKVKKKYITDYFICNDSTGQNKLIDNKGKSDMLSLLCRCHGSYDTMCTTDVLSYRDKEHTTAECVNSKIIIDNRNTFDHNEYKKDIISKCKNTVEVGKQFNTYDEKKLIRHVLVNPDIQQNIYESENNLKSCNKELMIPEINLSDRELTIYNNEFNENLLYIDEDIDIINVQNERKQIESNVNDNLISKLQNIEYLTHDEKQITESDINKNTIINYAGENSHTFQDNKYHEQIEYTEDILNTYQEEDKRNNISNICIKQDLEKIMDDNSNQIIKNFNFPENNKETTMFSDFSIICNPELSLDFITFKKQFIDSFSDNYNEIHQTKLHNDKDKYIQFDKTQNANAINNCESKKQKTKYRFRYSNDYTHKVLGRVMIQTNRNDKEKRLKSVIVIKLDINNRKNKSFSKKNSEVINNDKLDIININKYDYSGYKIASLDLNKFKSKIECNNPLNVMNNEYPNEICINFNLKKEDHNEHAHQTKLDEIVLDQRNKLSDIERYSSNAIDVSYGNEVSNPDIDEFDQFNSYDSSGNAFVPFDVSEEVIPFSDLKKKIKNNGSEDIIEDNKIDFIDIHNYENVNLDDIHNFVISKGNHSKKRSKQNKIHTILRYNMPKYRSRGKSITKVKSYKLNNKDNKKYGIGKDIAVINRYNKHVLMNRGFTHVEKINSGDDSNLNSHNNIYKSLNVGDINPEEYINIIDSDDDVINVEDENIENIIDQKNDNKITNSQEDILISDDEMVDSQISQATQLSDFLKKSNINDICEQNTPPSRKRYVTNTDTNALKYKKKNKYIGETYINLVDDISETDTHSLIVYSSDSESK